MTHCAPVFLFFSLYPCRLRCSFLHMAVEHKKSLGATYQLLIEPKPREPTKHQYDYDAQVRMQS